MAITVRLDGQFSVLLIVAKNAETVHAARMGDHVNASADGLENYATCALDDRGKLRRCLRDRNSEYLKIK